MQHTHWRAAHHWLAGFSAARLGKPAEPRDAAFEASYRDGYRRGSGIGFVYDDNFDEAA
jgi:hypothetical protein